MTPDGLTPGLNPVDAAELLLLGPHQTRLGYDELLARRLPVSRPGLLHRLPGIGSAIAYNPAVIETGSRFVLAARVESRDSNWHDARTWDPAVRFFERRQGRWSTIAGAPVFPLHEDPYATWIIDSHGQRQLLLGAVTLDRTRSDRNSPGLDPASTDPVPVTEFFMAPRVEELDPLRPVARIYGMKDGFRVTQLADRSLLMSTRPADGRVGENVLGLLQLDRIEDVNAGRVVSGSRRLDTGLDKSTFIALNEMTWLQDRNNKWVLGAMGCISRDTPGGWQFAPVVWVMDPVAGVMSRPVVIARRADFPPARPKFPDLADVLFPGSLVAGRNGTAALWTGVSDSGVGELQMRDPFIALGLRR